MQPDLTVPEILAATLAATRETLALLKAAREEMERDQ